MTSSSHTLLGALAVLAVAHGHADADADAAAGLGTSVVTLANGVQMPWISNGDCV